MSDDIRTESTPDPYPLPTDPGAVRLPSGGWAILRDPAQLTGRDVRRVRAALNADGTGDILDGALTAGIGVRVTEWQIPARPQLPLPVNGNRTGLDLLPADDLLTLEDLVRPWVMRVLGQEKKAEADPQ